MVMDALNELECTAVKHFGLYDSPKGIIEEQHDPRNVEMTLINPLPSGSASMRPECHGFQSPSSNPEDHRKL